MQFYNSERVAVFIDGANLYTASKSLGIEIDFKRLLDLFAQRAILVRALYYTAVVEDQEYNAIRPLVDWLSYNGFTVVTKPAKAFTDAEGRRKTKRNMEVEIAVDAMRLAPYIDHVVLFSGDGDFRRLVEALQERGRRVSVVSSLVSNPPMISDDLRRQADQFIELASIEKIIGREEGAKRVRSKTTEKS